MGQLSTTYKSSADFMCFYGMINFYIITMSYVYSPVSGAHQGEIICRSISFTLQRSKIISEPVQKDNPAFSMMNDSEEEEVIYDEDELSRRPLNCANKTNDYDSD